MVAHRRAGGSGPGATPCKGKYLNIADGQRKTYLAAAAAAGDVPDIAFLGGSTTFGVAQRDEHTIASEVARLAEADGLPIIAHNYGVSGWVNWQEMLLFEQLAADPGTRPDVAVFYDGANEVGAQRFGVVGVPSHSALTDIEDALDQPKIERDRSQPVQSVLQTQLRDLVRTYQAHSASSQILGWLRDQLDPPAEAAPAQQEEEPTQAQIDASVDVYRRGRDLIVDLAERYDVPSLLFWQPRQMFEAERKALDQIDEPTIDISDVLDDHRDVYIDGNNHNEEGSRIIAAAIWTHLRPEVEAWYRAHP